MNMLRYSAIPILPFRLLTVITNLQAVWFCGRVCLQTFLVRASAESLCVFRVCLGSDLRK